VWVTVRVRVRVWVGVRVWVRMMGLGVCVRACVEVRARLDTCSAWMFCKPDSALVRDAAAVFPEVRFSPRRRLAVRFGSGLCGLGRRPTANIKLGGWF
jgi:hypothetical protein